MADGGDPALCADVLGPVGSGLETLDFDDEVVVEIRARSRSSDHVADGPPVNAVTGTDAALAAVTFIASAMPLVGGPAAAVVSELGRSFDRREAERLAAVVDDLNAALRALPDRIDRDLGEDGQFALFLEAAIE